MSHAPGRAVRLKPLLTIMLIVAVIAAISYAYASPYIALNRLKAAIDARDSHAVSEYVDFPSLRISLKQQITNELMRRIDAKRPDNDPLAAIGALIGSALIGPLVDAYATPDGVAALMSGIPPRGEPGERLPEWAAQRSGNPPSGASGSAPRDMTMPADASGRLSAAASAPTVTSAAPTAAQAYADASTRPQTHAGYRNIDEFVVTYQRNSNGERYAAIFHRVDLFSWKLSAIDLHG